MLEVGHYHRDQELSPPLQLKLEAGPEEAVCATKSHLLGIAHVPDTVSHTEICVDPFNPPNNTGRYILPLHVPDEDTEA